MVWFSRKKKGITTLKLQGERAVHGLELVEEDVGVLRRMFGELKKLKGQKALVVELEKKEETVIEGIFAELQAMKVKLGGVIVKFEEAMKEKQIAERLEAEGKGGEAYVHKRKHMELRTAAVNASQEKEFLESWNKVEKYKKMLEAMNTRLGTIKRADEAEVKKVREDFEILKGMINMLKAEVSTFK